MTRECSTGGEVPANLHRLSTPTLPLSRALPALLLALAVALPTTALAQRSLPPSSPTRSLPGASLRTLLGRRSASPAATPVRLRTSPATVAWIQRVCVPPPGHAGPGGLNGPGAPGFTGLLYRLFVPATGYEELFALHVPAAPAGVPRPLLVGFHGYGNSHLDLYFNARELMDQAAARGWFGSKRLEPAPLQGELLADRDGRWGSSEVELEAAGAFGALRYAISTQPSGPATVELLGRENLRRVEVDALAYGLDIATGVTVRTDSADGVPATLVLDGIAAAPFSVLRNGVPATADCTGTAGPSWCFDAATQQVRIVETSASLQVWELN